MRENIEDGKKPRGMKDKNLTFNPITVIHIPGFPFYMLSSMRLYK